MLSFRQKSVRQLARAHAFYGFFIGSAVATVAEQHGMWILGIGFAAMIGRIFVCPLIEDYLRLWPHEVEEAEQAVKAAAALAHERETTKPIVTYSDLDTDLQRATDQWIVADGDSAAFYRGKVAAYCDIRRRLIVTQVLRELEATHAN